MRILSCKVWLLFATTSLSTRDGPTELRPNYSARQRCAIRPNFGTIRRRFSAMYNVVHNNFSLFSVHYVFYIPFITI